MKILIAPDKFKTVGTSQKIADILRNAVQKFHPQTQIRLCPLADGGDGTLNSIIYALKGKTVSASVHSPLMKPITASYGIAPLPEKGTAIVEMAEASGLFRLAPEERNPLLTNTFGTGELVGDAIEKHDCRNIYVTLGGSATVDGGLGFLQALGAVFHAKPPLVPGSGGKALSSITSIDLAPALQKLKGINLIGLADVQSPLLGPQGAAPVYGPQKGATPEMVKTLELGLAHFEEILARACGDKVGTGKGMGAGGGLGLALAALGGRLENGFDFVAKTLKLEELMKECDLVLTGEGHLDESTREGKTVVGVSRLAKKLGIPCVGIVGYQDPGLDWLKEEGLSRVYSLFDTPFIGDDRRKNEVPQKLSELVEKLLSSSNLISA
jgi:glycerate kinase